MDSLQLVSYNQKACEIIYSRILLFLNQEPKAVLLWDFDMTVLAVVELR